MAVATAVLFGGLLIYSEASGWSGWPGRWMSFAAAVRMSLFVLAPAAVLFGAWQGGRERRRRLDDQLASAARPSWRPLVATWAALTLGFWAGLFVVVAAGMALVAPIATYWPPGWWAVVAVAFVGIAAMSAVGVALGRMVPSRLVGPTAAVVCYAAMIYAIDDSGQLRGVEWLAPVLSTDDAPGHVISGSMSLRQTLWFIGLAAAALAVVGARRKWLALVPAAAAAGAAWALVAGPHGIWQQDSAAAEMVCTDDAPTVCLIKQDAYLMDDVVVQVQEALAKFEGIAHGPDRAVQAAWFADERPAPGDLVVELDGGPTLTGGLAQPDWSQLLHWTVGNDCAQPVDEDVGLAEIVDLWLNDSTMPWHSPEVVAAYESLRAIPEAEQRDWISRYLEAAGTCDPALVELLDELT